MYSDVTVYGYREYVVFTSDTNLIHKNRKITADDVTQQATGKDIWAIGVPEKPDGTNDYNAYVPDMQKF